MRIKAIVQTVTLVLSVLAAASSMAQQRGQGASQGARAPSAAGSAADRDRTRAADSLHDRAADRARDRDTLHLQDRDRLQDADIYGSAQMTPEELSRYRDRLRTAQSDREWAQIRAQHEEQMQARAKQNGAALAAPVYGQFMMTMREQQRYTSRLQAARTLRREAKIRATHQAEMQARARQLGVQLPPLIYGQQMMSAEEQMRYREQLQSASSDAARQQIMAEHRQQMQTRAREQRVPLEDFEND